MKEAKELFDFSDASVSGLQLGEKVNVYSIDGRLIECKTADNEGRVTLGLKEFGKGIYLIRTQRNSYKINLK